MNWAQIDQSVRPLLHRSVGACPKHNQSLFFALIYALFGWGLTSSLVSTTEVCSALAQKVPSSANCQLMEEYEARGFNSTQQSALTFEPLNAPPFTVGKSIGKGNSCSEMPNLLNWVSPAFFNTQSCSLFFCVCEGYIQVEL